MVGESQQADAGGTDSRSKNRDATRVSSKVTNVLTDPTESLNLVQEPIVSFCCLITSTEEAWSTQKDIRAGAEVEINSICHGFDLKL